MFTLKEKIEDAYGPVTEPVASSEDKNVTGARHDIATTAAFLIGVPDRFLSERTDLFDPKKIKLLTLEKKARIIRNLCVIRNAMFNHNHAIYTKMTQQCMGLYAITEIPNEALSGLEADGIILVKNNSRYSKNEYTRDINQLIKARINDCRNLFPEWISWDYMKNMFIMPGGTDEAGIKAAGDEFLSNKGRYPYQCYVNGFPDESKGNILSSDKVFVEELYRWSGDAFIDSSLVQDINSTSAKNIHTFFNGAQKIDIIVDCENSDPYRTCGCLNTLNKESGEKINKIILVNDIHCSTGWEMVSTVTDIPVKEIMLERIYEHKSIADMKIATETCREFFKNNVDSFILLSSDSDFWTLISSLPEARFIVLMEYEKCGLKLRELLDQNHYFYCFLNNFYSGDELTLMNKAVIRNFLRNINAIPINAKEIFEESTRKARTTMTQEQEEALLKKILGRLEFTYDDNMMLKFSLK